MTRQTAATALAASLAAILASGPGATVALAAPAHHKAVAPAAKAAGLQAPARPKVDFRLVEAAYAGDVVRLDALLAQGVETEVRDAHGYTPLLWAAQEGHAAVVDALLAQGANVEARSGAGHSVLMVAVARGHADVVRSLLRGGADPLARGAAGLSPYGWATAHAQGPIMKLMDRSMAGERL